MKILSRLIFLFNLIISLISDHFTRFLDITENGIYVVHIGMVIFDSWLHFVSGRLHFRQTHFKYKILRISKWNKSHRPDKNKPYKQDALLDLLFSYEDPKEGRLRAPGGHTSLFQIWVPKR